MKARIGDEVVSKPLQHLRWIIGNPNGEYRNHLAHVGQWLDDDSYTLDVTGATGVYTHAHSCSNHAEYTAGI